MKKLTLELLTELNNVTLITHRNCLDGTGTALTMSKFCKENNINLNIVYLQYGDDYDINDFKSQNVVMCDFSFDRETTEELFSITDSLIIIDHHKTAEFELVDLDYVIFDMNHSGAILMHKYLYDCNYPTLLSIIEDRDLWRFERDETEAVTTALYTYNQKDIVNQYEYYLDDSSIKMLEEQGNILLKARDKTISTIVGDIDDIKTINIYGVKIAILNNFTEVSVVGNTLAKAYGASVQYTLDHTKNIIIFSLRSVGDIDISVIAKQFNGGGHKNAAGFSIPFNKIDFNKFLKGEDLEKCLI